MYRLIRRLFCLAVDLFYRGRALGGDIPDTGPVILVANHPNGLIDPIMVMASTDRPVRFLAKEPLFRMPVIGWLLRSVKALPVYRASDGANTADNLETFRAVTESMLQGELICLFPEGISHDEPALQPLKTGAARMALTAEAARSFDLNVQIVPIGLHLREKGRFRSDAATWIGDPISIGPELADTYMSDPREAARLLTELIDEGIRSVTVNLNGWEDLRLLELAGRIWTDENDPVVRLKVMADAERTFLQRSPQLVASLRDRLIAFADALERLGIDIEDLDLRWRLGPTTIFVCRNIVALLVGAPIAFLGAALYFLPYQLVNLVARMKRPDADVVASIKVLASMLFFTVWQVAIVVFLWLEVGGVWASIIGAVSPFAGLYFHHFWERRSEAVRQASYLVRLPLRKRLQAALKRERDALRSEIDELSKIL